MKKHAFVLETSTICRLLRESQQQPLIRNVPSKGLQRFTCYLFVSTVCRFKFGLLVDQASPKGHDFVAQTNIFETQSLHFVVIVVVALFAIAIPLTKILATAALQFDVIAKTNLWWISLLGKFAMAEIFLLALYIVVAKGVGVGRLETGWGLYFFTFCVLASYVISVIEDKRSKVLSSIFWWEWFWRQGVLQP